VISNAADKIRRQIGRVDNPEVRKARTLARLVRTAPPDVLELGDSMVNWVASYDSDKRQFHRMLKDSFGPDTSFHAVHGGSYNPLIYNEFVRTLEVRPARPLVILPLTVRVHTLPWIEHPLYGHQRASEFLSTVGATTPLRRIRKGLEPPTSSDFAQFHALKFPTWAGDLTVGDYLRRLKVADLNDDDAVRLLYAYHHGGEVERGAPLDRLRRLGERLRRLGVPVIVYQTPVPVEKGVELHGSRFYELAERNFAVLEDTFVSGYGNVPILRTGLSVPTTHFIDWRDGSEHLNQHGRSAIAAAVVEAAKDLRSSQSGLRTDAAGRRPE
jgi:hypothetical protein